MGIISGVIPKEVTETLEQTRDDMSAMVENLAAVRALLEELVALERLKVAHYVA